MVYTYRFCGRCHLPASYLVHPSGYSNLIGRYVNQLFNFLAFVIKILCKYYSSRRPTHWRFVCTHHGNERWWIWNGKSPSSNSHSSTISEFIFAFKWLIGRSRQTSRGYPSNRSFKSLALECFVPSPSVVRPLAPPGASHETKQSLSTKSGLKSIIHSETSL